jgi:hypothetical protein
MTLLKPIQNTSLLTPYETFYIQSLHKDGSLISKQTPQEPNLLIQLAIKLSHPTSWLGQSSNSFLKVHTTHIAAPYNRSQHNQVCTVSHLPPLPHSPLTNTCSHTLSHLRVHVPADQLIQNTPPCIRNKKTPYTKITIWKCHNTDNIHASLSHTSAEFLTKPLLTISTTILPRFSLPMLQVASHEVLTNLIYSLLMMGIMMPKTCWDWFDVIQEIYTYYCCICWFHYSPD